MANRYKILHEGKKAAGTDVDTGTDDEKYLTSKAIEDSAYVKQAAINATKLDDLTAPDDNTDLNASITAHGLCPKLSNNASQFLNGTGSFSAPAGGGDVLGPATHAASYIPQWNGTPNSKTLVEGVAVPAGGLAGLTALGAKQDALTFGIADTNKVQINAADVADNDYAKFTATGLEGRSYAEVLSDIGAAPALGADDNYMTDAEKTKLTGIESSADVTDAGNVASTIHGATEKTTPVDADEVGLIDSAASNVLKRLTWANIKATLKAYFDTLYPAKDGWQAVSDSWAYASASVITVPSGAASLYKVGDKIKWTQTTVKYGVIVVVSDTELGIAVNTDYVVANAAISAIYYSHESSPVGFPSWFAFTAPSFVVANYDDGSGGQPTTAKCRYSINDRICTVHYNGSGVKGATAGFGSLANTAFPPIKSANYAGRSIVGSAFYYAGADYNGTIIHYTDNNYYFTVPSIADNTTITDFTFFMVYEI